MNLEIELTFLAKFIPAEVLKTQAQQLIDIYIPQEAEFPQLRIRKIGDRYELTKKHLVKKDDFSTHNEHTMELDQ